MPTLNDAYQSKKGETTPLLKGSVLPRKQGTVQLNVTGVREAPEGFNSPAIMDFEPVAFDGVEYSAIPLNKTNTKALMEIVGEDMELASITGVATFQRVLVNNPQTKALTPGLQLAEFRLKRGKTPVKPKLKPRPASRRVGKAKADNNDVPF